jgi:hypothetical protein
MMAFYLENYTSVTRTLDAWALKHHVSAWKILFSAENRQMVLILTIKT